MFLAISRNFLELLEHLQFYVYASACVMHLFHKDCSIVYSYTQLFSTGHCLQLTAVGLQLKKVSVLNAMMFHKISVLLFITQSLKQLQVEDVH